MSEPQITAPWSWSKIQAFGCPRRGYLRYAEKREEPESDIGLIGKALAEATAEYRTCWFVDHNMPSADALYQRVHQHYPERLHEQIGEIIRHWRSTGAFSALPEKSVLLSYGAERWFNLNEKFRPVKHARTTTPWFRGVMDFMYYTKRRELIIIDDKSGTNYDWNQGRIYAAAGALMMEAEYSAPETIYVRFNLTPLGRAEEQVYGMGIIEEVHTWLIGQVARIETMTEFPAVIGPACSYCGFTADCPEMLNAREIIANPAPVAWSDESGICPTTFAVQTQEAAEASVRFLIAAGVITDIVERELRAWVAEHGPVAAAGKVAEIRTSEMWSADTRRVVAALNALCIPPEQTWSALSMTRSALEKLCKQAGRPDLLATIMELGEVRQSERFGLYKDKLK